VGCEDGRSRRREVAVVIRRCGGRRAGLVNSVGESRAVKKRRGMWLLRAWEARKKQRRGARGGGVAGAGSEVRDGGAPVGQLAGGPSLGSEGEAEEG